MRADPWRDREVEKILREATLDGDPQPMMPGPLAFYRETLTPKRDLLETLLARLLGSPDSLDASEIGPPLEGARVRSILISAFQRWMNEREKDPILVLEELFHPEETDRVERLLNSDFFEPDKWLRNADDVMPVLGMSVLTRLPSTVRVRLREIYRSFVLGNYLAAIALSRAVLERSLIECSTKIGIDVSAHDSRYPGSTKRLEELVEDASEKLPHLRLRMESIRQTGNKALHPKRNDDPAPFPLALRNLALESLQAVRSVVGELYLDSR